MEINEILSKFQRVYKSGADQWQCLCPVHDDKSPSVGIKYTKDGRILIHCFSGCPTNEILDAVGISFDDLFPNKLENEYKPIKRAFNPYAVLTSLSNEILLCTLAAMDLSKGKISKSKEYINSGLPFSVANWAKASASSEFN